METPKQIAEKLVQEFMNIEQPKLSDYSRIYLPTAKACAQITIEHILKYSRFHGFIGLTDFYNEVSEEIKNI